MPLLPSPKTFGRLGQCVDGLKLVVCEISMLLEENLDRFLVLNVDYSLRGSQIMKIEVDVEKLRFLER